MASPSRHICVLTLLAVLLPLAACGGDAETTAADLGEIVSAKAGVDTEGAAKAFLMLPSGRLDVRAGTPVDQLAEGATTERQERTAPEGGVFVPLTWTYTTAEMAKFAKVFGRPLTVEMELVTGGESYPLAPPTIERDGQTAEAYYVAVDGSAEDLQLKVDYAGETQTVDLLTGKRSEGLAAGLYDLDPSDYSEKLNTCPSESWTDFGPLVQTTFTCTSSDAVVSPFIDGQWAPKGKEFAVVGVSSSLTAYAAYSAAGAGATYVVTSSREKSELDGQRPTKIIDENKSAGFAAGFLVFTLDGELPDALTFHRTYQLQRQAIVGDVEAPYGRSVDIVGELPLT